MALVNHLKTMKTNINFIAIGILATTATIGLGQATFTKITTGAIVTDLGQSWGCAWGDYNNDGNLDLFVTSSEQGTGNFLYLNNGDGTFTAISTGSIVTDGGTATGCVWGDFDNDGWLDLFVANGKLSARPNFLYRNNGDGTFANITSGNIVEDIIVSLAGAWGDYDNDGYIDLFAGNDVPGTDALYRNNGDSTFAAITSGSIVEEGGASVPAAWADYNNDGLLDLFVGNDDGANSLYRNEGNGTFTKITSGSIVEDEAISIGCAWGDYDNDGFQDLFVSNGGAPAEQSNVLYHNKGDGTFESVTSGSIVTDVSHFAGSTWGDYDNDGFLDLFVCRYSGEGNALYHNNGDGTFTSMTEGSVVNDGGNAVGCAWGDYDNDGFLDLFVANGALTNESQSNVLYRNNGNANRWLKIKLVGTVSNRAAIGAKVRLKATIGGKSASQLREISTGSGYAGQNTLAHFGLGSATNIDLVRIEWPSGLVQEIPNVAVGQLLTVIEPPRLNALDPLPDGSFRLSLIGGIGFSYEVQTSTDLGNWAVRTRLTNTERTVIFKETSPADGSQRFYRAVLR